MLSTLHWLPSHLDSQMHVLLRWSFYALQKVSLCLHVLQLVSNDRISFQIRRQ